MIDLRTLANQAIFRLQSAVTSLFRNFLAERDFTEIHSPKIIGAASEGKKKKAIKKIKLKKNKNKK